ncbi:DEAD/DEAH box helicase, partial [Arthrobacter deserti]|nr:DEAD/DEAH box helicase [Arthrobacter deserti]
ELGLNTTVIYGGVSQQRQEKALRAGVDIVVACPGRLEDLMKQRILTLEAVEITGLDEADHMADLGFLSVVQRLLAATPAQGQRLLFSATLDNGVDKLVKRFLSNPLTHSVDDPQAAVTTMEHHVLVVADQGAKRQLVTALASGRGRRVLVTRTKHHARKLAKTLTDGGIPAVDLHGNLSQNARDRNLAEFASGEVRVLVATDVAARGVHVDEVELVVHVDPPTEHKAYLHRSGRTARAGSEGTVVTVAVPEQKHELGKMMKAAGVDVAFESVSADSELVARLVGDVAATVDPQVRKAALEASRRAANHGQGKSTGANAQRKRAARSQGGAGRQQAPRGTARADQQPAAGGRPARPAGTPRTGRQGAEAARSRRPAAGTAQPQAARNEQRGSTAGAPAARRGPRRASAPASNTRRAR